MRIGGVTVRRTSVILAAVLIPAGIAAVVGMALLWPGAPRAAARQVVDVDVTYPSARVTSSAEETCQGSTDDRLPDGTIPEDVACLKVKAQVLDGAEAGSAISVWAGSMLTVDDVRPGTKIIVEHYPATADDAEVWAWHDFSRTIPLTTLALVFAVVTVAVARWRGLRAIIGLGLAFGVLGAFVLPGVLAGENPLLLGLTGSTVIMFVVLYLAHGLSRRTSTALVGTLAGLLLTTLLGVLATRAAHVGGVSTEDSYHLATLIGSDGAQTLRGLFLCGIVLAGLGVLNDVTITQASAVWELKESAPGASARELFSRGMRIGRDHIASTVYTIAFAYAGAALPVLLLVQLYQLPLSRTLTSGEFAEEIVRTLVGSIGLVLAIPLTTAIAAVLVTAEPPTARGRHTVPPEATHSHG